MEDPSTFPLGDTLANGTYRVTERLREGGSQLLYLAEESTRPSQRLLITAILAPKGVPLEELRRRLVHEIAGMFELAFIGCFDIRGDSQIRKAYQKQHFALAEKLPQGEWLVRLAKQPFSTRSAVGLALSVGRTLHLAEARGYGLFGVRPEYIWAERDETGALHATGLSDRYRLFLSHTGGQCAIPAVLLRRSYLAPELHYRDGKGSSASIVFSLATMLAEWATGQYPFPDSWAGNDLSSLLTGQHIPLEVPQRLAHLLQLGLQADPAMRPSLASFLAALEALSPEDLATE